MILEGAYVVSVQIPAHRKLHLFHVIVIVVPTSSIDYMCFRTYAKFQRAIIVLVHRVAFVEGKTEPCEAIEDISPGKKIHRSSDCIHTSKYMDRLIEARLRE